MFVRSFVHSAIWAIQPGLRSSQPGLRSSQLGLRLSQPGLRPSQPGLRPSQPQASGMAGWASGLADWGSGLAGWPRGGNGQTDGRTNEQKISPFFRTSSPIGSAAQKGNLEYVTFNVLPGLLGHFWALSCGRLLIERTIDNRDVTGEDVTSVTGVSDVVQCCVLQYLTC